MFLVPKTPEACEIDLHPNEIVSEILIPSSAAMFANAFRAMCFVLELIIRER